MIYRDFDQLFDLVRSEGQGKRTVAVVSAHDSHTLEAVTHAAKDGMIVPALIGHKAKIEELLIELDERPSSYEIIDADKVEDIVLKAAEMVNSGEAHFLMKGLIQTADMIKVLISDKAGFRTGRVMSHLSIVKIPNYYKLIGLTDAALVAHPDLNQKKAIVENAVSTMRRMGFDTPKVAILAANDQVSPKMPETVDAAELRRMNEQGELPGCIVAGPISYDLAFSREAAEIKGYDSPVCGDVDLLVAPNIAAANILLKALRHSAEASSAGIVVGGKVPIVLTSRAAEVEAKYLPLILAASATL